MKRASCIVGLFALLVACGRFDTDSVQTAPPSADGGGTDASTLTTSDAAPPAEICPPTAVVCDTFDDPALPGWDRYANDRGFAHVDSGVFVSGLVDVASDAHDNDDGARIGRALLADTSLEIEVDFTLTKPDAYRGHNLQLLSVTMNDAPDASLTEYLGLYASDNGDVARLQLTASEPAPTTTAAFADVPYGQAVHFELRVRFGVDGKAQLLAPGGTSEPHPFHTVAGKAPYLTLGLARQNGGTSMVSVTYDNFRVTKLDAF